MLVIPDDLVGRAVVEHREAGDLRHDSLDLGQDGVWVPTGLADEPLPDGFRDRLGDGLAGRARQLARQPVGVGVLDAEGHG